MRLIDTDALLNKYISNKYKGNILTAQTDYAQGARDIIEDIIDAPTIEPEQSLNIQDILDYLDTVLHPIVSPDHWNVYSELHDMISDLQFAQSERKKGKWVVKIKGPNLDKVEGFCSRCGYNTSFYQFFDYCPKCGAKMEGEERQCQ